MYKVNLVAPLDLEPVGMLHVLKHTGLHLLCTCYIQLSSYSVEREFVIIQVYRLFLLHTGL